MSSAFHHESIEREKPIIRVFLDTVVQYRDGEFSLFALVLHLHDQMLFEKIKISPYFLDCVGGDENGIVIILAFI
jgi:hypothetical protein